MFTNHKFALIPDPVLLHVHVPTNVIGSEEGVILHKTPNIGPF